MRIFRSLVICIVCADVFVHLTNIFVEKRNTIKNGWVWYQPLEPLSSKRSAFFMFKFFKLFSNVSPVQKTNKAILQNVLAGTFRNIQKKF